MYSFVHYFRIVILGEAKLHDFRIVILGEAKLHLSVTGLSVTGLRLVNTKHNQLKFSVSCVRVDSSMRTITPHHYSNHYNNHYNTVHGSFRRATAIQASVVFIQAERTSSPVKFCFKTGFVFGCGFR